MSHLVVGYPGPLAAYIARQLVERGEEAVVVGPVGANLGDGIRLVLGDCAKINFGLNGPTYNELCRTVQSMTVAETTEQYSTRQLRFVDVESARPVRVAAEASEFVRQATGLGSAAFLSSIQVFGAHSGTIFERDFDLGQTFSQRRDEVLAVAEKQMHRIKDRVPLTIVRIADLVGYERSGEILVGAELARLAQFALAAPDECEFQFSDRAVHFETIERATEALLAVRAPSSTSTLHVIDDEPWTDRQIVRFLFERLEKRVVEVPRNLFTVGQVLRAAAIQSGRVRTARADFQRVEAVKKLGGLLSRDVQATLQGLFGSTSFREIS